MGVSLKNKNKNSRTTCPGHRCLLWATWTSKQMEKGLACGHLCWVTAARNSPRGRAGGGGEQEGRGFWLSLRIPAAQSPVE